MSFRIALEWVKHCTPESRRIVLDVLRTHQDVSGLSSREIFQIATTDSKYNQHVVAPEPVGTGRGWARRLGPNKGKQKLPVPEPPNRNHPIRSLKYLKTYVLNDMASFKQIEKFYTLRDSELTERSELLAAIKSVQMRRGQPRQFQVVEWKWRLGENGRDPSKDEKIEREAMQRYEDELAFAGKLSRPPRVKPVKE